MSKQMLPTTKKPGWTLGLILLSAMACGDESPLSKMDAMPSKELAVIPPIAQNSSAQERLDADRVMEVRVALPLEQSDALDQRLRQLNVYGGAAPMTPAAFRDRHHPTSERIQAVRHYLSSYHLDVDEEPQGLLLKARGRVADLEAAFGTELNHFVGPGGETFIAPSRVARTPKALGIVAVHGLSEGLPVRAMSQMRPASSYTGPGRGLASQTSLSASTIRQAYQIPALYAGASVKVGLLQLDGYNPNDIASYARKQSLTVPPITTVLIDGASATAANSKFQSEVTADIEMVMAAIPQISEIRLYQGPTTSGESQLTDIYNEMANPTQGDKALLLSLSTSYGQFEDQLSAASLESEANIFKQFAAQGQTLFSASGDSGAYADGQNLTVINPAMQPFVTGVGGTQLTVSNGAYAKEITWTQAGGGLSAHFAMPLYQSNALGTGAASTTQRISPDVSLNADPNTPYAVVYRGANYMFGGTSLGAPIWASIYALAQAERQVRGLEPLGFFNTAFYALMAQGKASSTINDITAGDNGYYKAAAGFDAATGWGSPKASLLIDALVASDLPRTISTPGWTLPAK